MYRGINYFTVSLQRNLERKSEAGGFVLEMVIAGSMNATRKNCTLPSDTAPQRLCPSH